MFTNRRPYYGLKMSTTDFFREPVRYLKESNTQESMMEKPYLEDEYPKMHLKLPDLTFKPKEIPSIFGPIADGDPFPGVAMIDFGDAKCGWDIANADYCIEEPVIITMTAEHLWKTEFNFVAGIASDTIGVSLVQLGDTTATARDKQDYMLTFPSSANGSVTVCGFASTHVLISQTFETVVAGMPVGMHLIGGALLPIERGQSTPATLLKSVYGDKGDDCGCVTLSSNCVPPCGCKSIGFTTHQMGLDEEQTLTVVDYVEDCTYDWAITDGGGSLSPLSGISVTYTSPSSNTNCDSNPRIALYVNDVECDVLYLAVTNTVTPGNAYKDYTTTEPTCVGGYCKQYVEYRTCIDFLSNRKFESCTPDGWMPCNDVSDCVGCYDAKNDIRSEAQLEAGCCPEGLM
jgi:hypothetical protein